MSFVKITKVIYCKSEDPKYPASNLVSHHLRKKNIKWVCNAAATEMSCSVVLQLAAPVKITALQIGSYRSAYVQVRVRLSTNPSVHKKLCYPKKFYNIFVGKRERDINRVRLFYAEQFLEPARSECWDQLKLTCFQPCPAHGQFGLSLVNVFTDQTGPGIVSLTAGPSTAGPSRVCQRRPHALQKNHSNTLRVKPGSKLLIVAERTPIYNRSDNKIAKVSHLLNKNTEINFYDAQAESATPDNLLQGCDLLRYEPVVVQDDEDAGRAGTSKGGKTRTIDEKHVSGFKSGDNVVSETDDSSEDEQCKVRVPKRRSQRKERKTSICNLCELP